MNPGQKKLLLIFLIFALPFIAALFAYFVFPPAGAASRGELLSPPVVIADIEVPGEGKAVPWKVVPGLAGKWLILQTDTLPCAADCEKKMYAMRQAHVALGREQERVRRVFLLDEGQQADAILRAAAPEVIWVPGAAVRKRLSATPDPRAYIYLVDPLGNVFMRYRKDVNIGDIHKDLKRVLKASQIG